ncbi:MAG TPA: hypothetical protein VGD77_11405 [Gemmatimonadaceae bacterium]
MRIPIRHLLLGTGAMLLVAACRGRDATAAADPDLQRDLAAAGSDRIDLAASNAGTVATVSALESAPLAAPAPAPRPKRSAGPRVTRSEAPTEEAAPVEEVAEAPVPDPEPSPQIDDAPTQQGVALPRPVPQTPTSGGAGGEGTWGRGPSTGEVIGTVIGVVIRGGGVGDDHCDPRTDGRRGGNRRPIYRPIPDGQASGRGGRGGILGRGPMIGGGGIPINPIGGR